MQVSCDEAGSRKQEHVGIVETYSRNECDDHFGGAEA